MRKWFKKLFYIVRHFDDLVNSMDELSLDQRRVESNVDEAVKMIKDRATIHADVHSAHGQQSQIIMIGRYRNRDYIQVFEVRPDDFSGLLRQCIEMQKYAHMGKIDAPIGMKEIINTESNDYWRDF